MRGREGKTNLDYFSVDVGTFKDKKLIKLRLKYGPLGESVYMRVLAMIYSTNGYYLESSVEDLALMLLDEIGAKWCRDLEKMQEVVGYCAEIGLFDKTLMMQSVITSYGIQKRYAETIKLLRRNIKMERYCLLNASLSAPIYRPNVAESPLNVAFKPLNVAESGVKESKVNKRKEKEKEIVAVATTKKNPFEEPDVYELMGDDEPVAFDQFQMKIARMLGIYLNGNLKPITNGQATYLYQWINKYGQEYVAETLNYIEDERTDKMNSFAYIKGTMEKRYQERKEIITNESSDDNRPWNGEDF